MRGGYSDVNWFVRAARVVPVIAGAALVGGMIGGFAMFAIDSALTWEPAREPASQPRPDARAEGQASPAVAQTTKPARIVGGAIPDPSAGMSAPPPVLQQRSAAASAQSPAQISSQLLMPKPLGPASQLQSQTAAVAPTSGPLQNQAANQASVPTQAATAAQQPTRWPDALSRAHQNAANAANANSAQQQTAPPPGSEGAASNNGDADRKQASGDRSTISAAADDRDRGYTRHGRHSRRYWRGDDDVSAASSSRRRDARAYDRLYDSYGNRRDRSYGNTREQSYGGGSGDQDDAASRSDLSRSEIRHFGRDARYERRRQPDDSDRNQAFEATRPRSEPFWGGGYRDDD